MIISRRLTKTFSSVVAECSWKLQRKKKKKLVSGPWVKCFIFQNSLGMAVKCCSCTSPLHSWSFHYFPTTCTKAQEPEKKLYTTTTTWDYSSNTELKEGNTDGPIFFSHFWLVTNIMDDSALFKCLSKTWQQSQYQDPEPEADDWNLAIFH